ncbi:unnamed protein product [marine sediment metagenome]|uniref:Uncharacterized protein n=1 Tax=marine sediment metagenome TaxID=412755 RepID=X1MTV5_9ZZZZ
MMEFEEPGTEFEFEKAKSRGIMEKIRIATLFLVFLLAIAFIIKNRFDFNFLKPLRTPMKTECVQAIKFDSSTSEGAQLANAHAVVNANMPHFKNIEGFSRAYVQSRSREASGKRYPEIELEFKDVTTISSEIPEVICGFKISVIFK